jgi:glycosyltransferase involved in cell wall biosynthesis
MDFNISASIFECSGVSVEEALLLGKPMLVTRSGGANSLVNDDVAIVVDRGSTQALVDGIHAMIKRLPDFNAAVIKDYAWHNFEIDQVSQQYERLYRSVMEKKHE